jgi:hypothetical protein
MKCRWNRTMLNLCGIVDVLNWFPTSKNFYRLPIYRTNSTLSDFNDIWYVGRLWCPKLIPDWKFWKHRIAPLMVTYHYVKLYVSIIIYLEIININVRNFNFLPVAVFKMTTTILQKFNIVRYHQNCICG